MGMPNSQTTHDWIELEGAVNARAVAPGVLLRADNLQDLTPADVRRLIDEHGLQVVIDLRTGIEVEAEGPGPLTREPGVRIEHRSLYPESGNTDLDADDRGALWDNVVGADIDPEAPLAAVYLRYLARRPDSVVGALRDIARADGAVLVHCAAGKDRTGVVVALALDAVGVDRETIVADYVVTRERIDEIWDRLMSSSTYRAELEGHDSADHAPRPETMHGVFRQLDERHGGTVEWLRSEGFDDEDLARLRERLR
jgi:hypothetical protein